MYKVNIEGIVAHNLCRGIGYNDDIPWNVPEDRKLFCELTLGNIVIMGRKTFDSLKWINSRILGLPGRVNIVVSRRHPERLTPVQRGDTSWKANNTEVYYVNSLHGAMMYAAQRQYQDYHSPGTKSLKKIFIAGGASIYYQAIEHDLVDTWHVSLMSNTYQCDTFFPALLDRWVLENKKTYEQFTYYRFKRLWKC